MGDMAIFVSYDSADVWANRDLFELDEHGQPTAVSGVPPDYFSATGQRWGNPLYRWRYMEQHGFDWWVMRVKRQLELYDLLRLDHFRGFEAYWRIPATEETALNGEWIEAPGHALFDRLKSALGGSLPFIAEDLGVITDKVEKLRTDFDMPGMRVLQFGFAGRGAHLHLPHKYVPNMVVYTGTHDNNTTLGWWRDAPELDRNNLLTYLGPLAHENDVVWAMIRAAERSVASICLIPIQDLLHLGSEGRMNTPSVPENNWTWRYSPASPPPRHRPAAPPHHRAVRPRRVPAGAHRAGPRATTAAGHGEPARRSQRAGRYRLTCASIRYTDQRSSQDDAAIR